MNSNCKSALICDIPISLVEPSEVLGEMDGAIQSRRTGGYISITNTESMYHALRRPDHFRYVREADFSLCDGVGVIVAGWAWGSKISRFNGPILQLECCRYGVGKGWRHFFYGGKEGVAETLSAKLKGLFPGLQVAGTYCPPFRPLRRDEEEALACLVEKARPDIIWVGLGLLKQEQWIAEHLNSLKVPWMVGVGGAFDYHSGAIPWAPRWIRALGLEWLFRLILQPKLRAKRYWWSLVFVVEAIYRGIVERLRGVKERPRKDRLERQ